MFDTTTTTAAVVGGGIIVGAIGLIVWTAAIASKQQKMLRNQIQESMLRLRRITELFERQVELLERQVTALEKLADHQNDKIQLLPQNTESGRALPEGIQERGSTSRQP